MRRFTYIWIVLTLSIVNCQLSSAQDVQRFSERHIMGTARYVGMGGAMTAVGGDPSAVMDNPAGLGLYRRSEVMLTIDETIDRTYQTASQDTYQRARFAAPQVSAIWALGNPMKQRGLIYSNLMFSISRLANFNRDVVVSGKNMGMLETICSKTHGLDERYLQNKPWDDVEIGWLSILGYEAYLIDPKVDSLATDPMKKYQWVPAVDFTDGSLSITESGTADQYTFSWAGNISNQWYVGVNISVPTFSYTKRISLLETDRIHSAELNSMYHISGVGFNAALGLIYRPTQYLRIGASFQTPTWMGVTVQTEGDMYSTIASQSYEILTPASGSINEDMISPLRSSVSVAGQLGSIGLLAVQYDYAHAADINDVHTLRVGAEVQVYRGLYINAGYVYESSFLTEEPVVGLDYNSIRTDTDYRYNDFSQYASLGLGYRSDIVVAQVAYQYRWQTLHQYASEMQYTPFDVNTSTHRIVATLAWRF